MTQVVGLSKLYCHVLLLTCCRSNDSLTKVGLERGAEEPFPIRNGDFSQCFSGTSLHCEGHDHLSTSMTHIMQTSLALF